MEPGEAAGESRGVSRRASGTGFRWSHGPAPRGGRTVRTEVLVPVGPWAAFRFVGDPRNLDGVTPPWFRLRILRGAEEELDVGSEIEYRLRIRGVPFLWRSRIEVWDPPHRFAYRQERGPYRAFVHDHVFEPDGSGTVVRDVVDYRVPGGAVADRLLVLPALEGIFRHRSLRLAEVLGGNRTDAET